MCDGTKVLMVSLLTWTALSTMPGYMCGVVVMVMVWWWYDVVVLVVVVVVMVG